MIKHKVFKRCGENPNPFIRGIGPHLMARGKSHGFSRVAVGTLGMLSSYGGDGPSKLVLVQ